MLSEKERGIFLVEAFLGEVGIFQGQFSGWQSFRRQSVGGQFTDYPFTAVNKNSFYRIVKTYNHHAKQCIHTLMVF